MDHDLAEAFLSALGCESVQVSETWVRASCPLAHWNHASGKDSHPSFGLQVGTKTFCHCFACGYKGSPTDLVLEIRHKTQLTGVPVGVDLGAALQLAQQESAIGFTLQKDWAWKKVLPHAQIWPENWITSFFPVTLFSEPMAYLQQRNVTTAQALEFGLRYDQVRKGILFPLRNRQGSLIGARGRMLQGDLKYFDYKYKNLSNAKYALWNLERASYSKPLVLVEGTFDALSVARVYLNVVACLGVSIPKEKLSLLKNFLEIWVFFDQDQAGLEGYRRVKQALKGIPVRRVTYQGPAKDPGEMSIEEIQQAISLMETNK